MSTEDKANAELRELVERQSEAIRTLTEQRDASRKGAAAFEKAYNEARADLDHAAAFIDYASDAAMVAQDETVWRESSERMRLRALALLKRGAK